MEELRTRMDRWITAPSRTGDKAEPPLSDRARAPAHGLHARRVSGMREIFYSVFLGVVACVWPGRLLAGVGVWQL